MQVICRCCWGLDIHKKFVVACLLITRNQGVVQKEVRTFGTMTEELLAMSDWLAAAGCTQVAMESTSFYWRPVYNLLEGQFELLVVNAYHIKAVPGRKTDVKDAEWIADLLRHGLLRASYIPSASQRHLRDLTRTRRHLVEERARVINRMQAVLEEATIKLAAVVTDIRGVSARAILEALIGGEADPTVLAELARGRLRTKRELLAQAVVGRFSAHHAFLIGEHLSHLDYLDESVERIGAEIQQRCQEDQEAIELLDTVPGISQRAAEELIAEIGTDRSVFPSAKHLASWVGICPGNKERGGRRLSGKTRTGNVHLRQVLIEIAPVASKTKDTYLAAQYRRIAARRGKKRALVALAHTILVILYYILKRRQPYQELGGDSFDQRERQRLEKRLLRRLGLQRHPSAPCARHPARHLTSAIFRRGSYEYIIRLKVKSGGCVCRSPIVAVPATQSIMVSSDTGLGRQVSEVGCSIQQLPRTLVLARERFMIRLYILLLLTMLATFHPMPASVQAAAARPAITHNIAVPAQQGEPTGKMGHTPWEGTNWGLFAAFAYSAIALGTAIVILSVIFSWPHRRR